MKHNSLLNYESQHSKVDCPVWLKKRILNNLRMSAQNQIYRKRAKKAQAILATINTKPKDVPPKIEIAHPPVRVPENEAVKPAQNLRKGWRAKVRSGIAIIIRKLNQNTFGSFFRRSA